MHRSVFIDRFGKWALEQGSKIAIKTETGADISYKSLFNEARNASFGDNSKGTVALLSKDPILMMVGILGCWMSNKTVVPLHYSYPGDEILHRVRVSGSDLVLTDNQSYPALSYIPFVNHVSIPSIIESHGRQAAAECSQNEDALVLFTSGTTGKPKGVLHSFDGLWHQLSDLQTTWELSQKDHFLVTLPLNHIHGFVTGLLSGLWQGAQIHCHSNFDVTKTWSVLKDPKTTFFTAVPAIYSRLLSYARATRQSAGCLDHLRLMISGSSGLSEKLANSWCEEIRREGIVERYGMTETGMIASNLIKFPKTGTVGQAFPSVELKIQTSPESEFGEILVKGPGLFEGYLKEPTPNSDLKVASKDILFEEHPSSSFFSTGDFGYLTSEGDLRLVGRSRDIFKVSGFKVGAGEIEAALNEHPSVIECCILGLDHGRVGEKGDQVIASAVHLDSKDGCDAVALKNFLATKLAHYKIPRKWHLSSVPLTRNIIGKFDQNEIKKLFIKKNNSSSENKD